MLVEGALVRSRHLAETGRGARVMRGTRRIDYHHLLRPLHGLVRAADVWVESFYPGPEALRVLTPVQRAEIVAVVSGCVIQDAVDVIATYGPRVRPLLSRRAALCERVRA